MRLNVGCGLQVLDGWVNVDLGSWDYDPEGPDADLGPRLVLPPGVEYGDASDLSEWHGRCDIVLLNHVLHLFNHTEADQVLDQCAACLVPGGRLAIVEADPLRVIDTWLTSGEVDPILTLVADDIEPTVQGKLLRWVTWHGTRRSLWSVESLAERMERRGLQVVKVAAMTSSERELIDTRPAESFSLVGIRP